MLLIAASDAPMLQCTERETGARSCAESASKKTVGRQPGRGQSPNPVSHQSAVHMKTRSHVRGVWTAAAFEQECHCLPGHAGKRAPLLPSTQT